MIQICIGVYAIAFCFFGIVFINPSPPSRWWRMTFDIWPYQEGEWVDKYPNRPLCQEGRYAIKRYVFQYSIEILITALVSLIPVGIFALIMSGIVEMARR